MWYGKSTVALVSRFEIMAFLQAKRITKVKNQKKKSKTVPKLTAVTFTCFLMHWKRDGKGDNLQQRASNRKNHIFGQRTVGLLFTSIHPKN